MKWLVGETTEILAALNEDAELTQEDNQHVEEQVRQIIKQVIENGDQALKEYSKRFDQVELEDLLVSEEAINLGYQRVEDEVIEALEAAKENIISYHKKQKQYDFMDTEKRGVLRGQLVLPLARIGVYVPGGTASYPSSVLMNVLPAKIAGVKEIIMVTPPSSNSIPDVILAAAKIAGVDKIFQIGGAHSIAALAYGTQTVPKVDKIVGPGNIYVATAKKQVFGVVGIDMIAGPSEIGILADQTANPTYIAADLLSQAEHDTLARAILVTDSTKLAEQVEKEIYRQLDTLPRKKIAEVAIKNHGLIIIASTVEAMFTIMNEIAPEHLEVQLADPISYLHEIKNAGSIFLGEYASEPVGDYFSGTNHVLPTSGTAKFYSPLGVYDFVKYSQVTYYTKEALAQAKDAIALLARKEGLEAHARAIECRFD
ncbi:histidinol dehydrogenase [Enterococcus haemoperoxidus ATCC BAA-382]|uniref:Histidinol dehydrogenase n=1 Tax=Enterococcus haemoperoxidus ATCC BAA-382 TaxID=1158608 RepID=R2Q986_9ENTE|nr:histidinol dehydrogenase [Enterococcus haemoperoxidus]EOH92982.1 histidinol dehydrogenase [Enterococcus haemoperoxidus ATCC BAA-382]EOT61436.1 histidinol dehydrogenase [Enterococcus haemoperoxidus ATCC BAA-382]